MTAEERQRIVHDEHFDGHTYESRGKWFSFHLGLIDGHYRAIVAKTKRELEAKVDAWQR